MALPNSSMKPSLPALPPMFSCSALEMSVIAIWLPVLGVFHFFSGIKTFRAGRLMPIASVDVESRILISPLR